MTIRTGLELWGPDAIGCYGDGAHGHVHIRAKLAELLDQIREGGRHIDRYKLNLVTRSLQGTMPDDAWDEDAALDFLNDEVTEGLTWGFHDGDLMLSVAEEDD